MSNRPWSAPPVIENATALFAAVASASVADSAVTSVVFSTTVCVAGVVHTGRVVVLVHEVDREGPDSGCAPSFAVTSTAKLVLPAS